LHWPQLCPQLRACPAAALARLLTRIVLLCHPWLFPQSVHGAMRNSRSLLSLFILPACLARRPRTWASALQRSVIAASQPTNFQICKKNTNLIVSATHATARPRAARGRPVISLDLSRSQSRHFRTKSCRLKRSDLRKQRQACLEARAEGPEPTAHWQ
jgi:hypothetical protein